MIVNVAVSLDKLAEDAARRLRGEACQNCDHYAVLTGHCWLVKAHGEARAQARREGTTNEDEWCKGWTNEARMQRGNISSFQGSTLDQACATLGVYRKIGEDDTSLRERCRVSVYGEYGGGSG